MTKASKRVEPDTPILEWIAGAIGLLLFIGVIALTVVNGMKEMTPPTFAIRVMATHNAGDGHHIVVEVANQGDATAAAVQLRATITDGNGASADRDVEIDLIPPQSRRLVTIIFPSGSDASRASIEVLSFREP